MTAFSALRTTCALRYRDIGLNVITDAQWKEYVNQAYQKVNAFSPTWPWLETSEQTVTINAGVRSAALPTDVFQVNWVYDTTDNLRLIPQEGRGDQWRSQNLRTDTGVPVSYRLRAGNIEVFPLPTANTTIVMECVLLPSRLSADGDLPVFPSNWHEILVPGALALAYLDDGNSEWYKTHYAQFQEELVAMRNAIQSFRTEAFVPIRDVFWG